MDSIRDTFRTFRQSLHPLANGFTGDERMTRGDRMARRMLSGAEVIGSLATVGLYPIAMSYMQGAPEALGERPARTIQGAEETESLQYTALNESTKLATIDAMQAVANQVKAIDPDLGKKIQRVIDKSQFRYLVRTKIILNMIRNNLPKPTAELQAAMIELQVADKESALYELVNYLVPIVALNPGHEDVLREMIHMDKSGMDRIVLIDRYIADNSLITK